MKKRNVISLLACTVLLSAPVAYAGEHSSMSDTQHRKTMGGLHHPESAHEGNSSKERSVMSDAQHRKTMGGSSHPKHDDADKRETKGKKTMSDAQHRKTMGGHHHPDKD